MISQKIQDALNKQINAELYSSYLYLSMASWFEEQNLTGFAQWMSVQVQEENFHGMRMYHFLNERGGRVILKAIDAPKTDWKSPLEIFEDTYAHEQKVTKLINDLVYLAREERDNASEIFMQWFVTEQVEEEATADGIVKKLKLIKDSAQGLFMLDAELGTRVFTPPTIA